MGCSSKRTIQFRSGLTSGTIPSLDQFYLSELKDFVTFHTLINRDGIHIDTVKKYIEESEVHNLTEEYKEYKQVQEMIDFFKKVPPCPECGYHKMDFHEVNTNPANQVGGDFRFAFYCPEMWNCGYEEYTKLTFEKYIISKQEQ